MKLQKNQLTETWIATYQNKTAIAATRIGAFYALIALLNADHYDQLINQ